MLSLAFFSVNTENLAIKSFFLSNVTHFGADFARFWGGAFFSITYCFLDFSEGKKKKSYAIPYTLVIMAAVDLFFSWQYFKSD